MPAPAAVGVDDDLAAGDAGVGGGTAVAEVSRRVHVELRRAVPPVTKHAGAEHLAHVLRNGLLVRRLGVLRRDYHRGDFAWLVPLVEDRHLGLAVGAEEIDCPGLAILGEPPRELVCKQDRQRHQLVGLVGRVPEHDALVSCPLVAALARRGRHALGNLGGLLGDDGDQLQCRVAEGLGGIAVADFLHRLPYDRVEVEGGRARDLSREDDRVALAQRLACDAALRIGLQTGVEHRVRDVVAHLVRMAL